MIRSVLVVGAGSAGLIAALTLKVKLPQLVVRVLRSPEIGVIGVGEGSTATFPRHFFEYLKLDPGFFYRHSEPTWKLGIKFLWGPREAFYYSFAKEYADRHPQLRRNNGFYMDDSLPWAGRVSAFMAKDKAFPRRPDGRPLIHNQHSYHIENRKLVNTLELWCRQHGVEIQDGTLVHADLLADGLHGDAAVSSVLLESGERLEADLYVDASGFRSELIRRTLNVPYRSYGKSLFCDRAVIGGWPRSDEPIKPYTVAETYDAGWAWQIEHENWINRGYVYSSSFLDDESALAELMRKNPRIANEPRVVRFSSGRSERTWVGNVVGIGNSVGFVEPLEATALQVITLESASLADSLIDAMQEPGPRMIELYNTYNCGQWDDIRDFLAVHYAFNTRLDTAFWRACQHETDLGGAKPIVDFFVENGPSGVATEVLLKPTNSFGIDGYQAMLVGQQVRHEKRYQAPEKEQAIWREIHRRMAVEAESGMTVEECLAAIRRGGVA